MESRALSPNGDSMLVAFLGSQVIKFRVSKQRGRREERRKARGIKSTGIKNSFERKTRGGKQAEGAKRNSSKWIQGVEKPSQASRHRAYSKLQTNRRDLVTAFKSFVVFMFSLGWLDTRELGVKRGRRR